MAHNQAHNNREREHNSLEITNFFSWKDVYLSMLFGRVSKKFKKLIKLIISEKNN
jgi:hypothetical protein